MFFTSKLYVLIQYRLLIKNVVINQNTIFWLSAKTKWPLLQ